MLSPPLILLPSSTDSALRRCHFSTTLGRIKNVRRRWKWIAEYYHRSMAETAMHRGKQSSEDPLALRDWGAGGKGFGHGACIEQNDEGGQAGKRAYCLRIRLAAGKLLKT